MPASLSASTLLPVISIAVALVYYVRRASTSQKLPPSPAGALPYLGHLTSIADPVKFRLNLIKWGEQFQDVFMLHVGPRRILILNSERAISDLYDKRGAIYSSRPLDAVSAAFFSEKSTAFTPSGKMHRWARSLINETFGPNPSKDAFVKEMVEREAGKLVDTLKSRSHLPGFDLVEELGRTSISTVWAMMYAGETVPHDQVPRIAQALRGYSKVSGMGSRLVSLFPFLAKLGVQDGDIRAAREARQNLIDLIGPRYLLTLERVKRERMVEAGQLPSSELDQIEPPCHARSVAEAQLDGTIDDERALWLIVGLLSASIDSTGSSLHWALSFVAENPRVQGKAHEILDQVVGYDRPPNFTDTGLEYIRAIIKESTRLWPVSPTGMARLTDEDDIYNGYFIPKGTTVMMNLRHLSFDDSAFDNARVFEPERWLRPGATLNLQDRVKPFGTGRRLCPGIHVATEVMYMVVANILWSFEVSPKRSDRVSTVDNVGYGTIIVGPSEAEIVFKPRHK